MSTYELRSAGHIPLLSSLVIISRSKNQNPKGVSYVYLYSIDFEVILAIFYDYDKTVWIFWKLFQET